MALRWTTGFLDFSTDTFDRGVRFWQAVTGSSLSSHRGERGEFASLVPLSGDSYLRVQDVGDSAGGCHVDLQVDDLPAEAERAVSLGATTLRTRDDVVVLRTPGGWNFCLVADSAPVAGGYERSAPVAWPGGQHSLADQICVDIPAEMFERECDFLAALTGWPRQSVDRPEFEQLERPRDMPLRLLLQRLDETEPGTPTRAHVDFACDDAETEARRHESLGASQVRTTSGWITLRDPSGQEYCITRRDPFAGN